MPVTTANTYDVVFCEYSFSPENKVREWGNYTHRIIHGITNWSGVRHECIRLESCLDNMPKDYQVDIPMGEAQRVIILPKNWTEE